MSSLQSALCCCLFLSLISLYQTPSAATSHVHIVYMGHNNGHDPVLTSISHVHLLSNVFSSEDEANEAMIYSYRHGFSGFAAMLNSTQATTLAKMEGVVSVFRSKMLQLHTTRSWDFMGLNFFGSGEATPMQLKHGSDVVVGVFDTGVWPESESFREEPGTGPIPSSWKGTCVKSEKFDPAKACNRKLIGARYYIAGFEHDYGPLNTTGGAEFRSPRDRLGHGTHTASTAVGSAVKNASYFGLGAGVARGGAPLARLAVYKICWVKDLQGRCSEADILAAFDDAIHDGVHVISASIGSAPPFLPFFMASSDIGSFHAMQLGVTVVFSAGNDGPDAELVQNVAPWVLTVAAGTIDRNFPTQIILGNNISLMGEGFITRDINRKLVNSGRIFDDGSCAFEKWTSRRKLAAGEVVLCFSTVGGVSSAGAALAVLAANGSGMIFAEPITKREAEDDFLPTVHVNLYQGTQILDYIRSSRDPMVQVRQSRTDIGRSPAPTLAYFSSRGPSSASPNILKPDITAPGVNILAAWPPISSPTFLPFDGRSVNWNFDSGTSMSCPHISGIVALLKSAHPDWSPAAIKSALMTTAYVTDTSSDIIVDGGTLKPVDPFDVGAGHVNPLAAMNPGLVYDMDARDHVLFLCSMGYTETQIRSMTLPSKCIDITCDSNVSDMDLNYPAIVISDLREKVTVKRTLRNVAIGSSAYFATVVSPQGVRVFVWPKYLVFSWHKEANSYYVTVTPVKRSRWRYDFGEIVWTDGYHRVRTPLIVSVNNVQDGGDGGSAPALLSF